MGITEGPKGGWFMLTEKEVVEALGQQLEKIKELLGGDYEEFANRYESLKNLAAQAQDNTPQVREEIFSLYAAYPAVQKFLETTSPQLFEEKVEEQAPVTPITGKVEEQAQGAPTAGKVAEQAPATPVASASPQTEATPTESPAPGETPSTGPAQIPAESKIQIFKERVTAFLAVLVVSFTLGIAVYVIGRVGDTHFNHAKDILILLLGPFGTALGYYFGRMPGDALAAQAQQSAAQASQEAGKSQARADQISDQAVKVADAAEAIIGEPARTQGISDLSLMQNKTQRLQAETRELLKLARRR
jgi:hypothetical protein